MQLYYGHMEFGIIYRIKLFAKKNFASTFGYEDRTECTIWVIVDEVW